MSCPFAWRGMISGSLHHGSLDDDALGDVLPEGHEQLALHRRDLVEQQFETIELAADLGFQMSRQQASVPRPQGLEPRPSISPYRRVVGYSLREQKPLDPVHMLDPLRDQCPSLPAKPAAVLF